MNMSALSVLYLVLPFVGVFALHEIEELATASRWAERFREKRLGLPPVLWFFLGRFPEADRKELWVTAIEEMLLLVVITGYLLSTGSAKSELVWVAAFLAYSVHSLAHIVRAVIVRGYFPGLATAALSLPFVGYGIHSIALVYPWGRVVAMAIVDTSFAVVNLLILKYILIEIRLGGQKRND